MDESGNMLDYNSFTLKHGFACHPKQFFTVINAIPLGIIFLMICSLSYSKMTAVLPLLYVGDIEIENKLCTNKYIRKCIIQSRYPCQILRNKLDQKVCEQTLKLA